MRGRRSELITPDRVVTWLGHATKLTCQAQHTRKGEFDSLIFFVNCSTAQNQEDTQKAHRAIPGQPVCSSRPEPTDARVAGGDGRLSPAGERWLGPRAPFTLGARAGRRGDVVRQTHT